MVLTIQITFFVQAYVPATNQSN